MVTWRGIDLAKIWPIATPNEKAEIERAMKEQFEMASLVSLGGGGGGGAAHHTHTINQSDLLRQMKEAYEVASATQRTPTDINSAPDRIAMIASRLRCTVQDFPFRKFASFVESEKVHIFIVLPAGPTVLEDDVGLFPSDTLVTQLRLLLP